MRIPTEEEMSFGQAVRRLLIDSHAVADTRRHADDPHAWNRELWDRLTTMGIASLLTDGETGAAIEAADAWGRYPATVPVLAQAVLLPALLADLDVDRGALGDRVAAIGPFGSDGRLALSDLAAAADGAVSGVVPMTLSGAWADTLVTVAPRAGSVTLMAVDLSGDAARVHPRRSMDTSLPFADVHLSGAQATVLAEADGERMRSALRTTETHGMLWCSAGEVGTAQRLLDLAVDYARQRVQFGMPIGRRQAIKHRAADMLILVESARSALWAASELLPTDARWAQACALMRLASGRAVEVAAQSSFQIHGGIGFTWEHDLHLLFKRALASRSLFGGMDHHYTSLISILGQSTP